MNTVKLTEPIQFGSETISELKIRKPKAKDMRSLPASPTTGDMLDLAGRLSAQPSSVIDELCIADMTAVLEVVGNFFAGGLGTGKN